jgi:hypothetical protein
VLAERGGKGILMRTSAAHSCRLAPIGAVPTLKLVPKLRQPLDWFVQVGSVRFAARSELPFVLGFWPHLLSSAACQAQSLQDYNPA